MNLFFRTIGAFGVLGGAFFLQFVVSAYSSGIFFLPAVALYVSTFLPVAHAAVLGIVLGGMLDALSPLMFGVYMASFGISMVGARVGMRFVDEKKLIAHGIVGGVFLGVFLVVEGGFFFAMGYRDELMYLFIRDSMVSGIVLVLMIFAHALCLQIFKKHI
ncbi:MAG: hypothetical protein G01um101429_41 [Parcubacteria group bacterium Gr01-1014_29]|nr:MAG: hypothetical protein G01um101429_41 [Parcubacteria group bacterium Gr01-1014_29]